MLNILLIFVPITIAIEFMAPQQHTAAFVCASLAIIALAGWLGKATEHLAEKTGEGIGGLVNATLGNAAELIIAIFALQKGLFEVVKASITGSIIGNVLLILGAAFLAGGCKHRSQTFNAEGARTQASMLTLAAIALVMPAVFHLMGGTDLVARERSLSFDISIVLLLTYVCAMWFSLKTHKHLFSGVAPEVDDSGHQVHTPWSLKKSIGVLVVVTGFVAWMSEILVGAVEPTAAALGMNHVFVGVFVVAIVGNAAEHSSAILVAMKNRMDLSLGIALGSSTQIALFVAPLLVILSTMIAPQPMDLIFSPVEVFALFMSVIIAEQIASDGNSNWFEGIQLLSVYIILGLVFYFLPGAPVAHPG